MTSSSPVFLFGASGHARVAIDVFRSRGVVVLACLVSGPLGPDGESVEASLAGVPVRSEADALDDLASIPGVRAFVAIGDNGVRARVAASARVRGLTLANAVSAHAYVAPDVRLGSGILVVHNAVINAGSVLGDDVIVNTGATVDHDGRLADAVHVAPGCHLAGNVSVGRESFLGVGTSVIPGIAIGARSVVGAGSVVIRDLGDDRVAWGNPAHHHETENRNGRR